MPFYVILLQGAYFDISEKTSFCFLNRFRFLRSNAHDRL